MLRFDPPEFENEFAKAIRTWKTVFNESINIILDSIIDVTAQDYDAADYDDQVITIATEFELSLPESDVFDLTYGEFVDFMAELDTIKILTWERSGVINLRPPKDFEFGGCLSRSRCLSRIACVNEEAEKFLHLALPEGETDEEQQCINQLIAVRQQIEIIEQQYYELRTDLLNDPQGRQLHELIEKKQQLENERDRLSVLAYKPTKRYYIVRTSISGQEVVCSLTRGLTIFGICSAGFGNYTEWQPPVDDYELFIEIRYSQQPSDNDLSNLIEAYLFELNSSVGLEFEMSPRILAENAWEGGEEENHILGAARLRPLLIGHGMDEVLQLYNRATSASDSDVRILYFTKVIEYISQTVVRQQATEIVRAKLLSSRALQPDAEFIAELEVLIEEQRSLKKDREAVKQTIITCCEGSELAKQAPPFLKELRGLTATSKLKERDAALEKLGYSLSATRNSIAHAKANYTLTGEECPQSEITQFAECARIAAQQAIRWYHARHELVRI